MNVRNNPNTFSGLIALPPVVACRYAGLRAIAATAAPHRNVIAPNITSAHFRLLAKYPSKSFLLYGRIAAASPTTAVVAQRPDVE